MRKTFTKSSPAMMASAEMAWKLSATTLTAATILSDLRPAFHLSCADGSWSEQFGKKSAAYQFRS